MVTGPLLTLEDVPAYVSQLRRRRKIIVSTNGTFDILHYGHVYYLQEAKKQGDVLIVGVNDDASVQALKGLARPIVPAQERAQLLLAIRYVDAVVIFKETDPINFIAAVSPDVHVNGAEYGSDCIESDIVRRIGARLHLVPRQPCWSSTKAIEKILHAYTRETD